MSKKIGVIGSGTVGQTLAKGFLAHGYDVMLGTNTPAKRDELKGKIGGKGQIGSFKEAAAFGDILVFATKGSAAESSLEIAGPSNFRGKTVIDTTNPIAIAPPVNGVIAYFTTLGDSLMERLQRAVPDAHFVKSFSCIGNAFMVNPDFNGVKPTMFICGNHDGAKAETTVILDQFGFEVEDLGKVEAARAIEPLCMLWCIPGFLQHGWTHALKLLRK